MRVAVCLPQVPFERGGAEILCDELVNELRERNYDADLVSIPFKWYPEAKVLTQAFLWRLVDLTEANGRPIDLVIATKFPSYVVTHPRKVVWLVHQFRQAYELDGTDLGQFGDDPKDRATRRAVHRLDKRVLAEAERLYATSTNNAERLARSTGLKAEVLRHPPRSLPYRCDEYGDFVLSVGRLDRAKRVDLVLEAARDADWRLVVAGDGPERAQLEERARELGLGHRAEFVGRVSDAGLADLYARCLAVYYAPVDEDSGLVPYEAFLASKPVVTTRDAGGPVEVVDDGVTGLVCAPQAQSLREALDSLYADTDRASALGGRGKSDAESLTWDRVVRTFGGSMKVAHFSPMPPERTGIADYSALLLPELRKHMEVSVAKRGTRRSKRASDLNVYHIGNNPDAHSWIVEALRRTPGLVVLHDLVLHHLVAGMTLGRGDAGGYIDAMHRDAGVTGRLIAHGVVDGVVASPWEVCPERFTLVGELFPFAQGMVVHSHYVEDRLREVGYQGPVWRVPMPAWPRSESEGANGRRSISSSGFRVLSFGNLNTSKRLPQLIRAFDQLRHVVRDARLVLAGTEAAELNLDRQVAELGMDDVVEKHGWVDEATLWSLIDGADVCVALRQPTMGETSSVVLRALSTGLPVVVSDDGWYSELPATVAAKVAANATEHEMLVATLTLLAERPDVRAAMSREARSYVAREHDVETVGDAYAAAIEELAGNAGVQVEVARDVARSAADVGIDPTDPDVAAMGRYLRELGL